MVGRSFKPASANSAATSAKPAAAAPYKEARSGGTKPSHVLKFKNPETGKFERLTGLFASEGKDGSSYLKGMDKNSGVTYIVVVNDYANKQDG